MPLSLPLALLLPTPETGESGPLLTSDHTQQVLNALIPKTTMHELSDLPKAGQGGVLRPISGFVPYHHTLIPN